VSFALALAALAAAPSQYTIPGDDVFPEGISLRPGTRWPPPGLRAGSDHLVVAGSMTGLVFA